MSTKIFKLFGAEIVITNPIPSSIAEEPKPAPAPKEAISGAASIPSSIAEEPKSAPKEAMARVASCVKKNAKIPRNPKRPYCPNPNDPGKFKKRLTESDLGGLSRLLVPRKMVVEEILPLMDEKMIKKVEDVSGLKVEMVDEDTGVVHEDMVFRLWPSCKSYVINGFWSEYSRARQLKINDEIGLRWDALNRRFHFSLLRKATGGSEATKIDEDQTRCLVGPILDS